MNIFLDTTVLYGDPFLNKRYNKHLIELSSISNDINIFISDVVLAEAMRHYQINIEEMYKKINEVKTLLNSLPVLQESKFHLLEKNIYLEKFDEYYNDLEKQGIVKIVKYSNDILPELVNRSIHRIKPFSEKKEEFRDAIIWLTYSTFAEENQLNDCFFITANTSDYGKNGKFHENLLKDSTRFKLIKNTFGLNNESLFKNFSKNHELQLWFKKQNLTKDDIEILLSEPSSFSELYNEVNRFIEDGRTGIDIIDYAGAQVNKLQISALKNWDYEVAFDEIYIDLEIEFIASIKVYGQDWRTEKPEVTIIDNYKWEIGLSSTFNKSEHIICDFDLHSFKWI